MFSLVCTCMSKFIHENFVLAEQLVMWSCQITWLLYKIKNKKKKFTIAKWLAISSLMFRNFREDFSIVYSETDSTHTLGHWVPCGAVLFGWPVHCVTDPGGSDLDVHPQDRVCGARGSSSGGEAVHISGRSHNPL